jgi:hypothetical protein
VIKALTALTSLLNAASQNWMLGFMRCGKENTIRQKGGKPSSTTTEKGHLQDGRVGRGEEEHAMGEKTPMRTL